MEPELTVTDVERLQVDSSTVTGNLTSIGYITTVGSINSYSGPITIGGGSGTSGELTLSYGVSKASEPYSLRDLQALMAAAQDLVTAVRSKDGCLCFPTQPCPDCLAVYAAAGALEALLDRRPG